MHLMMQHIQEAPKEIRTKDKVRRSLAAVTMRCLAKDRAARYQSMGELIADLNAIAGGARIKQRRHAPSGFSKRLKVYVPIAILASAAAFSAATFELWAPQVVLYTNIPFMDRLMDRNQAETIMALREANRLRLEGTNKQGAVDPVKFRVAETILAPSPGAAAPPSPPRAPLP
jgi:hypothetical protein